jgi:catechol 1,2-dioxygenase
MTVKISHTADVQKFFEQAAGFGNDEGNPRLKRIVQRVLQDTARLIEDLEVTEDEFWHAVDYLNRLGGRGEAGLLVAGLGIEHFLDLLQDAKDAEPVDRRHPAHHRRPAVRGRRTAGPGGRAWTMAARGRGHGDVPRRPGAAPTASRWPGHGGPVARQHPRHLFVLRPEPVRVQPAPAHRHRCRRPLPRPLHRAVRLWLRPAGPTQECLDLLGRHGQRPAHIHFFISAPGTGT